MAMRCFWPPDNWPPPAPTKVLYFSGKLSTKLNWASAQAWFLVGWGPKGHLWMVSWCVFSPKEPAEKDSIGKVHHDAETSRNHPAWVKSSLLASGKPCMMLWRMELAKSTGSWHVSTVAPLWMAIAERARGGIWKSGELQGFVGKNGRILGKIIGPPTGYQGPALSKLSIDFLRSIETWRWYPPLKLVWPLKVYRFLMSVVFF